MNRPAKFWDNIADRYSKKPVTDEAAYQQKLQVTRGYLRPEMEVLEIGCGTGSTAISLAPLVKHIRATDISSKMIEIAQRKADAGSVANITFECVSLEELNVADGTYDAVLGFSVLHLLENRDDSISTVYRMLKPGGLFVSSTVCLGDRMKFFKLIGPIGEFLGLMPLVRVFTRQELSDSLTRAGFAIDHQWRTDKAVSVFMVAKKAE